jgi:hypothetical protein
MAVRYTTTMTDAHGVKHTAQRTSRNHVAPKYVAAFWAQVARPATGESVWECRGYSSTEARAEYEAGALSRWALATLVAPVTAEILK